MKANIKPRDINWRKSVGRPRRCRRCIYSLYGLVVTDDFLYRFPARYCMIFDVILETRDRKPFCVADSECFNVECTDCNLCGCSKDLGFKQLFCAETIGRGRGRCPKFKRRW